MKKVTVGRVVHYHPQSSKMSAPRAALVVAVFTTPELAEKSVVSLNVFSPNGESRFYERVQLSVNPQDGCWSWPQEE